MFHPNATATPAPDADEYGLKAPGAELLYDVVTDIHIIKWRTESFEALGFAALKAMRLAMRRDVDREKVGRMLTAGAAHDVVMDIVL